MNATATLPTQIVLGGIIDIDLAKIASSPNNPRKTFGDIDELAASIVVHGLLENLVVRPNAKKPGTYILVAGERRLRALKLNKATSAPCKVIEADEGQALAAAIVENLQRDGITALEEAEAFAALQDTDPAKWNAMAIAKTIGKTDRFVQQRITIARGLSMPLKKRFAAGELTVEAARTLATFPPTIQADVPDWAIADGETRIRERALLLCVPESAAAFDVALYKGDYLEDAKKRRYFADTAQFLKLQRPAAEKKLEEVKAEWPDANLVTAEDAGTKWHWSDQQYAYGHGSGTPSREMRAGDVPTRFFVPKVKSTAIVWIAANGEIRKALGVCTADAINEQSKKGRDASATNRAAPARHTGGEKPAHRQEREAFNKALVAKMTAAILARLHLFNLITGYEGGVSDDKGTALLPPTLRRFKSSWNADEAARVAIWLAISKLKPVQVAAAIRAIQLADLPTWRKEWWQTKPVFAVAVAQSLGVTPPAIALPDPPKVKAEKPKATTKPKAKKAAKKGAT
jgi:ParB/RepB/Spo0J family partition protein